ncbi:MAG: filamentous hemagglutinin N-terminal domain-containing protein [Deltaproteobacteria bacterium]|nr:filamentous hemagglutinin N-terminal domain-containing protein [Deltaproteobacteria bacterium]
MDKRKRYFFLFTSSFFISLAISVSVFALPEPNGVVFGEADFEVSDDTMYIRTSDKVIINYDSFSISEPETVNFLQPSSSSCALNRVISSMPSDIFGSLLANGRVFLINPNGILFGPHSRIDTGGFLASTLDICNDDFPAGEWKFILNDEAVSSIVNKGEIIAGDEGFIALISPHISNEGIIQARLGKVILASGENVSLDFSGDGIINVAVEAEVLDSLTDADGNPINSAIDNSGRIKADGGMVFITAETASGVFDSLINQEGIIKANSLVESDGRVMLTSNSEGVIENTGVIDTSAAQANADGGEVTVRGSCVGQFGEVHADAVDGNGGRVELYADDAVALSSESLTTANAGLNGDGGEAIVFGGRVALVRPNATLTARGGSITGDGGFIETSGLEVLDIGSVPDAGAPNGASGVWLIDPNDITISGGADANMDRTGDPWFTTSDSAVVNTATLAGGLALADVTIQTRNAAPNTEAGDIIVSASVDKNGCNGRTLTLDADNNIVLDAEIFTDSFPIGIDAVNLVLDAANFVDINAAVDTGGGDFISNGVNFDNSGGTITASGGIITINNTGAVIVGAGIVTGQTTGGSITFTNPASLTLKADLTTLSADIVVGGGGDIIIGGSVTLDTVPLIAINGGSIDFGSSNIYADAAGYDLILRVGNSSDIQNSGDVTIGLVDDNGGLNNFLNDLTINSQAVTNPGTLTFSGNISLDDDAAADSGDFVAYGSIVLPSSITIDTEQGDDAAGGSVSFVNSTTSASAAGVDLSIDTSTANAGSDGGNVSLDEFSNDGGSYINDLSVDTSAGAGGTAGALTLEANIYLDNDVADTGDFTVGGAGDIIISSSLTVDTEQGSNGDAGTIDFGSSNIYADAAGYDLTLDVRGGTDSGNMTLGLMDDNGGTDYFIDDLMLNANFSGAFDVQAINTAGNQSYYGRTTLNGDLTSTTGSISIGNFVTLAADVIMTSGGGVGDDISTYVVNGGFNFTLDAGAGNVENSMGIGIGAAKPTNFTVSAAQAELYDVRTEGDLSVTATDIDLDGTRYWSMTAGEITFDGDVDLFAANPIGIQTAGLLATDDITFTGTVNGSQDIDLTAGAGDIAFSGAVGDTTAIGDGTGAAITINSGNVDFLSTLDTASGIIQADGAGLLTFRDDVTIAAGDTDSVFNADVTLDGLTLTSAGELTFGNAAADALTLSGDEVVVTTEASGTNQTYNCAIDGAQGLDIQTGPGQLTLPGAAAIGGVVPLDYLSVNTDSLVAFGQDITTSGANGISITVTGAGNSIIQSGGTLSTGGNPAVLQADDMTLSGAINAGAGNVTLTQTTNDREIDMGTNTAGKLGLTDAELDTITAAQILIGNADSGTVTITDNINPANSPAISITTGGSILDGNGDADNITATADSTLWAAGVIGTADDSLEVNINGGDLSVYCEGESGGTSVNVDGTILPSNTLTLLNTPPGSVVLNDVDLTGGTPILTAAVLAQLNPYLANEISPLWSELLMVDEDAFEEEESPLIIE